MAATKLVKGLESITDGDQAPQLSHRATVHNLPRQLTISSVESSSCSYLGIIGYPESKETYEIKITLKYPHKEDEIIDFIENMTGFRPLSSPRNYTDPKNMIGTMTLGYETDNSQGYVHVNNVDFKKVKQNKKIRF